MEMPENLRLRSSAHVVFLLVVVSIALSDCLSAQTAKRALVISLDGLDVRYLADPDKYSLKIPTLRHLMRNGVTSRGVYSVYHWPVASCYLTEVTASARPKEATAKTMLVRQGPSRRVMISPVPEGGARFLCVPARPVWHPYIQAVGTLPPGVSGQAPPPPPAALYWGPGSYR